MSPKWAGGGQILREQSLPLAGALGGGKRTSAHRGRDDSDTGGSPQLCSYSSLPLDVALRVRITNRGSLRAQPSKKRFLNLPLLPLRQDDKP